MDDATYNAILDRVATGELVTDVCAEYGISRALIWKKSEVTDEGVTFTRARVSQAHSMAEDTVKLADSAQGMDADGIAAIRVRVDARKWLTTKIAPRLYGDKIDITSDGKRLVSGVIMLPPEDSSEQAQPLTASTVTARMLGDGVDVDATIVQAHDGASARSGDHARGAGGGDGTGTAE